MAATSSAPPNPGEASMPDGILPASHWQQTQLPAVNDDADSAYGSQWSETTSLSSSVRRYRVLQGRTYHADIGAAESWEPNDNRHIESMDLLHFMVTLVMGDKLFLAPVENPQKVLDVGTGTGLWAIEFGDLYPGAEVIGTDITPIQPSWVPPNVRFEIEDANLDWAREDNTFDFIHARTLTGNILHWDHFFAEAYRCLKPGGWLESQELDFGWKVLDGEIPEDSAMGQYVKVWHAGGEKTGRSFRVVDDNLQEKWMERAGFVDIEVKDLFCPYGAWPEDPREKEAGILSKAAFENDMEGYILHIWHAVLGWTPEEIQNYVAHLRRELRNPNLKIYFKRRVVIGRKPQNL